MVKKKAILGVLAVILVLLLAGCYLFKPPVGLFVAFTKPGTTVNAAKPVLFAWDATCTAKDASLTYTLYIKPESAATITVNTNDTEFATALEVGKYTAFVVAKAKIGKDVKEAVSKKVNFTAFESGINFTTTTTAYAMDTVSVAWEPVDGLAHTYAYSLDGGSVQTTTATSATFTGLSEGEHTVAVKITDSKDYPNKFDFVVDMTGPDLWISQFGRDYGLLYGSSGNVESEGRYGLIDWIPSEPLGALYVRFYRYDPETGQRERLALVYNDEDGVYDTWEATDSTHQPWYPWDPNDYDFLVSNGEVTFDFTEGYAWNYAGETVDIPGKMTGKGLFKLGTTYAMYFLPVDTLGNWGGGGYLTFKLDERYSDNDEPVVELIPDKATVTPGGTFTVTVKAKNVKEYVADHEHSISGGRDVSFNSTLTYIQIPVMYSKDLTVSKVEMPNFMPEKIDLCATNDYQAVISTPDATFIFNVLTIYRGFVNGADEGSATDVLAEITFEVPSDYPTGTYVSAQIGYEGMFAYYSDYSELPNSIFRDSDDRPIDGIVTDLSPQSVLVATSMNETLTVKHVSAKSKSILKKVITPKRVPLKTERGER